MSSFEKEYYESEQFWAGNAIQDENNLNRFRETVAMIPEGTNSLADIGCGNGLFLKFLMEAKAVKNLIGVDRSNEALKHVPTAKMLGDVAALPLGDKTYECVSCLEVIEHLPLDVYRTALAELSRVSSKYIIISVPYDENLEENHTQCPQCMTIFNADLHLRTFTDKGMRHIMDDLGFECVNVKKVGAKITFKGHYRFRRIFYPHQFKLWRSPICPICGYGAQAAMPAQASKLGNEQAQTSQRKSLISYFTGIPKMIWPKETKYFWIMGLYKRR